MPIATHYEITHKCGHSVTRDLSNKVPFERAGLVKWLSGQLCRSCDPKEKARKEQWLADKQAQAQMVAENAEKRFKLDPMTGPEKIRGWAGEVSAKIIQDAWDAMGDDMGEDAFAETIAEPANRG